MTGPVTASTAASLPAPALRFPPELLLQAQGRGLGMKAAIFDVDGVLTDGTLWIGAEGEQMKPFHVLDGHGSAAAATTTGAAIR